MRAMQNLHVLTESQGQPAEVVLTFQTNEMLDHIVVRMIDVYENTRRVIQTDIAAPPRHNVAEANRDGRLDCDIPIVNPIEMREQNIIVVNSANRQAHTPLKTLRRRRNAGPGAINLLPTFRRRWWINFRRRRSRGGLLCKRLRRCGDDSSEQNEGTSKRVPTSAGHRERPKI